MSKSCFDMCFQRCDCGLDTNVSAEESDSWPFATPSPKKVQMAGPSVNKGMDTNNNMKSSSKGQYTENQHT